MGITLSLWHPCKAATSWKHWKVWVQTAISSLEFGNSFRVLAPDDYFAYSCIFHDWVIREYWKSLWTDYRYSFHSNFYYLDQLRIRKLNWLLAASQYDVLNIRAEYRRVISSLDIPIYTEMTNELQKYKLLDIDALNSLIREYKYTFKAGNDWFVNLEVHRDTNVYIPNRTSCKSDALSRQ